MKKKKKKKELSLNGSRIHRLENLLSKDAAAIPEKVGPHNTLPKFVVAGGRYNTVEKIYEIKLRIRGGLGGIMVRFQKFDCGNSNGGVCCMGDPLVTS